MIVDGKVNKIGLDHELNRLQTGSVKTLDLNGQTAFPGFADSHIHLMGLGMLMRNLDLSRARCISDIQEALTRASLTKPREQWIIGRGWDQEKLKERRYPDRRDIDVVPNPVFLRRVCGHIAVANSAALSAAMVTTETSAPSGGEIERDSSGGLTGVLKERALELVARSIPRNETETKVALLAAAQRLLESGFTSLHCIIEDSLEFKVLLDLKERGEIRQNIYAILPLSTLDQARSLRAELRERQSGFSVGGLKIFLDGSLGGRTAALNEPYDDNPDTSGMLTMTREQLSDLVEKTRRSDLQLCIHAIGDKAVEMGVDVLDEMLGEKECRKSRHRIEHASLTSPESVAKMARLGIIASVQPRFIFSDSWAEKRLGLSRISHLYPLKSMIHHGVHVAGGSDSPSDDCSAIDGLWSAVVRPGLPPEERLTVGEAISCYTIGAAYGSFSENEEGTLEPGKWANLTVLNADPFEIGREEIRKIRVVRTIVRGEVFP